MKFLDTPLSLSDDFQYALNEMEHGENHLFVTGKAGTGKSTLLKLFKDTSKKNVVVLAPTGIAALNVAGQTIHSFFRFPPKWIGFQDITKRRHRALYKKIDVLILDEVSMIRADMLDNIDYFLRLNRDDVRAFGGVKCIFFGDLYQLPPIISNAIEKKYIIEKFGHPYFFAAKIFARINLEPIELRKVYRQEERRFIKLLDKIRTCDLDYEDLADINERFITEYDGNEMFITLSPRNAVVDRINKEKLSELDSPTFSYLAKVEGQFRSAVFPAPLDLKLKVGAQVMFVKNDPQKRFVNGTIGTVAYLDSNNIKVKIGLEDAKSKYINVDSLEWEIFGYSYNNEKDAIEQNVKGVFKQYPLNLAWAITIHKSQGQTFDRVLLDIGRGAFEFGQTYVALSRSRTFEGIVLKKPLKLSDIKVDPIITDFYRSLQ